MSSEEIATTRLGRLEGEARGSVVVFKGVPYAAPPLGALRFRAPQPPQPWSFVRDARVPGPTAPQVLGIMRDLVAQDEDCLTLNVWTPALDGRARPVMVFVHGGAFTTGASTHPMYDGHELAARGAVVVVSFNYRLGALGFADVAALSDGGFEADTNLGLRDQLAALRWVQAHIESFGGDPGQVTLFGHSAGAMSAATLLASPHGRGLFRGVIAQSGAGHHVASRSESMRIAQRLVDALGLGPRELGRLRELPCEAIAQAQLACLRQAIDVGRRGRPLHSANMTLLPVVDGDVVPELPIEAAARGAGADLPLLIGTTADEHRYWVFLTDPGKRDLDDAGLLRVIERRLPGRAAEVIERYRELLGRRRSPRPWEVFVAIETDRMFVQPATRLAEARSAATAPTFVYRFDFTGPLFEGQMGACHTMDVPFVLGLVDEGFGKVFTGGGPAARGLSEQVMDAWLAFARGGDPSSAALGPWPRYESARRARMRLASDARVESGQDELAALWSELV